MGISSGSGKSTASPQNTSSRPVPSLQVGQCDTTQQQPFMQLSTSLPPLATYPSARGSTGFVPALPPSLPTPPPVRRVILPDPSMVAAAAQAAIDKAFGRFAPSFGEDIVIFGVLDPFNPRWDGDAQYIPAPDVLCYHLVCACRCRWSWGRDRELTSIRISSAVGLLAA